MRKDNLRRMNAYWNREGTNVTFEPRGGNKVKCRKTGITVAAAGAKNHRTRELKRLSRQAALPPSTISQKINSHSSTRPLSDSTPQPKSSIPKVEKDRFGNVKCPHPECKYYFHVGTQKTAFCPRCDHEVKVS